MADRLSKNSFSPLLGFHQQLPSTYNSTIRKDLGLKLVQLTSLFQSLKKLYLKTRYLHLFVTYNEGLYIYIALKQNIANALIIF